MVRVMLSEASARVGQVVLPKAAERAGRRPAVASAPAASASVAGAVIQIFTTLTKAEKKIVGEEPIEYKHNEYKHIQGPDEGHMKCFV